MAAEEGCGYWDGMAFMGGELSMVTWAAAQPAMAQSDHLHLTRRGYARMGMALTDALMFDYDAAGVPGPAVHPGTELAASEPVLPRLLQKLERLGCKKGVVGLVLPTGYSFNLDGTAIYLTLASLFIAQACNIHLSPGQIAAMLGITLKTVESHRSCIARQLGLRSPAGFTRHAVQHGLIALADSSTPMGAAAPPGCPPAGGLRSSGDRRARGPARSG